MVTNGKDGGLDASVGIADSGTRLLETPCVLSSTAAVTVDVVESVKVVRFAIPRSSWLTASQPPHKLSHVQLHL